MRCSNHAIALCVLSIIAAASLSACKQDNAPAKPDAPAATSAATEKPGIAQATKHAVDAVNPLISPKETVVAAMRSFRELKTYHAQMQLDLGKTGVRHNTIDFQGPDRIRMQMDGVGTQIAIGDTMYMQIDGRAMKVPMPEGTLTQWRDPLKLDQLAATMTVEAQGSDTIDGASAQKFLVRNTQPAPSEISLWIADGLPLRMVSNSEQGKVTVTYSRFDDPSIQVHPPK